MKFAVVILAFVAVASAQYKVNPYKPLRSQVNNQYYKPTPAPYRTYAPVAYPSSTSAPRVVVPVGSAAKYYQGDARNAETLKYGNEVNPDGSYNYFFETNNGIAAQEQGTPRNFGGNPPVEPSVAQGSFSWTSPEGKTVVISYIADENGYQPSGEAIPTPPPVPAQILRALEYIATHRKN